MIHTTDMVMIQVLKMEAATPAAVQQVAKLPSSSTLTKKLEHSTLDARPRSMSDIWYQSITEPLASLVSFTPMSC